MSVCVLQDLEGAGSGSSDLSDLVETLTRVCVCVFVLGTGVTVNALHPGVVATDLGRHTGMHQSQFSSTVLSKYTRYF